MRIAEFLEISQRIKTIPFRGHELTLSQGMGLIAVSQGATSPTKMSESLKLSTAAATGVGDRLERIGAVARKHAAHDRRKIEVFLTEPAARWLEEVFQEPKKELVERMTPEALGEAFKLAGVA